MGITIGRLGREKGEPIALEQAHTRPSSVSGLLAGAKSPATVCASQMMRSLEEELNLRDALPQNNAAGYAAASAIHGDGTSPDGPTIAPWARGAAVPLTHLGARSFFASTGRISATTPRQERM